MMSDYLAKLYETKVILVAELIAATAAGHEAAMKPIILKLADNITAIKAAENTP
jgi:hypothetical protein